MQTDVIHNTDCLEGFRKLPDNSIDIVLTSPPYNVGIDYDSSDDSLDQKDYYRFTNQWLTEAYRVLKDDGRLAINIPYETNVQERGGRQFLVAKYDSITENIGYGFAGIVDLKEKSAQRARLTAWGSWLKPSAPYIYNPKECIVFYYKNQWKHKREEKSFFDRVPLDEARDEFMRLVFAQWEYQAETRGLTKANFSISLPENILKILTYENDIVLDPFMGSGTTAVACAKHNRRYIGFEISPEYTRIANERVNTFFEDNSKITV